MTTTVSRAVRCSYCNDMIDGKFVDSEDEVYELGPCCQNLPDMWDEGDPRLGGEDQTDPDYDPDYGTEDCNCYECRRLRGDE